MFPGTMEAGDFKDFAKAMTDYIAEYLENIRDRYLDKYLNISKNLHCQTNLTENKSKFM